MPLAKIHIAKGRYDDARIAKVSGAVKGALMSTLDVPPDPLAAETRKPEDIAEASRQVLVCVERENWWKLAGSSGRSAS